MKLSRKIISGEVTDLSNSGRVPAFFDGVNMWYVRLRDAAISSRFLSVDALSSSRGSYPPSLPHLANSEEEAFARTCEDQPPVLFHCRGSFESGECLDSQSDILFPFKTVERQERWTLTTLAISIEVININRMLSAGLTSELLIRQDHFGQPQPRMPRC